MKRRLFPMVNKSVSWKEMMKRKSFFQPMYGCSYHSIICLPCPKYHSLPRIPTNSPKDTCRYRKKDRLMTLVQLTKIMYHIFKRRR